MGISSNCHELKRALLEKGWSYKDLCNQAPVSTTTVTKVMRGERVTAKVAKRIADALGKPVTELFIVE